MTAGARVVSPSAGFLSALATALFGAAACEAPGTAHGPAAVVYLTDFGTRDGAVAAMKGVARQVDPELVLDDLTHEIAPFDIWEAAYRLRQTMPYWPSGTVFVSVVDPGVGTARKSVVVRTATGHLLVTPDNGTSTLIADDLGITAAREIDPQLRLPGSEWSSTFHGRDVYSYTAALLAAGRVTFEQVGASLAPDSLARLEYQHATFAPTPTGGELHGMIPVLDVRYGNVWTNIPRALLARAGVTSGTWLQVTIARQDEVRFRGELPFVATFADVAERAPLAYVNSLGNLAFALNMADFAATHRIEAGHRWRVLVTPAAR